MPAYNEIQYSTLKRTGQLFMVFLSIQKIDNLNMFLRKY